MIDTDKLAFKDMIVAVFAIYNKPPPEKEMLRIWFHKLSRFEFSVVAKALDVWTDTPNKLPQPADIISLCKPREDVYFALPSPVNYEQNKKHVEELTTFVAKKLKQKTKFFLLRFPSVVYVKLKRATTLVFSTVKTASNSNYSLEAKPTDT